MFKIVEITDINASELEAYNRLSEAQLLHYFEPKEGVFIAESPLVIERALNAGYKPLNLLVDDVKINHELINRCAAEFCNENYMCSEFVVYTASMEVLSRITGFKLTRGALCMMQRKPLMSPEAICRNSTRIAVLEDVVNPTNVGAIMRSAAALNMDAVLLTKPCSDPLYRRAARVSMGTVFQIPWTYIDENDVKNDYENGAKTDDINHNEKPVDVYDKLQQDKTFNYIKYLHQMGFATAAMALTDSSVAIDDEKVMKEEKLAIVLGTEGEGLRQQTIDACDYTVKIPMSHGVDSLNVAAASAVAFWQLGRKVSGGLKECEEENVSKTDKHSEEIMLERS